MDLCAPWADHKNKQLFTNMKKKKPEDVTQNIYKN